MTGLRQSLTVQIFSGLSCSFPFFPFEYLPEYPLPLVILASAEKVDDMARQRTSQSLWAEILLPVGDDVAMSFCTQVAISGNFRS